MDGKKFEDSFDLHPILAEPLSPDPDVDTLYLDSDVRFNDDDEDERDLQDLEFRVDEEYGSDSDIIPDAEMSDDPSSDGKLLYPGLGDIVPSKHMRIDRTQRPPSVPLEELSIDDTVRELQRLEQGLEPLDRHQMLTWRGHIPEPFVDGFPKNIVDIIDSSGPPKTLLRKVSSPPRSWKEAPDEGWRKENPSFILESPKKKKTVSAKGNVNKNQLEYCAVCVSPQNSVQPIFDSKKGLLEYIKQLFAYLDIQINDYSPQVGVCTECLNHLLRWHVFTTAIKQKRAKVVSKKSPSERPPLKLKDPQERTFKDKKKLKEVQQVYLSGTHRHFCQRRLSDKDWEFFCDNLFHTNSLKSKQAKELEAFLMSPLRLSHICCTLCDTLIPNTKGEYVHHKRGAHGEDPVTYPCDICGLSLPEKEANPKFKGFYHHWISHFFLYSCEVCPKKFPTKRSLSRHVYAVHKNRQQCDTCGKMFTCPLKLGQHMLSHGPQTAIIPAQPAPSIPPSMEYSFSHLPMTETSSIQAPVIDCISNGMSSNQATVSEKPVSQKRLKNRKKTSTIVKALPPNMNHGPNHLPETKEPLDHCEYPDSAFLLRRMNEENETTGNGNLAPAYPVKQLGQHRRPTPTEMQTQLDMFVEGFSVEPSITSSVSVLENVDDLLGHFPENERAPVRLDLNKDPSDVFTLSDFIDFESTLDKRK